jgi:hypothetical protein
VYRNYTDFVYWHKCRKIVEEKEAPDKETNAKTIAVAVVVRI